MRKYLWLGAMLAVAVALGVFGTARYAARHPDSFCSTCLQGARLGLYLWNPLLPQAVHDGTAGACPACRSKQCGQAVAAAREDRLPNVPRVPKPAKPAAVKEPEEVIHIEQIDPMVAKAIAEALEVPQLLEQIGVPVPTVNQGPDEVVLTILDIGDPILFTNPKSQAAQPQAAPSTNGSARHELRMPYCADSEEELAALVAAETKAQTSRQSGIRDPRNNSATPGVEEATGWLMPDVEGDETETPDSQNASQLNSRNGANSNRRPTMDSYPHEPEGCPYLNGQYCPHYSQPYYPTPATQPETQQEETVPATPEETEPPAPPSS